MKTLTLLLSAAFALSACGEESQNIPAQSAASAADSTSYTNSAQAVLDMYRADYQVALSDAGVLVFENPDQLFEALNDYSAEHNRFEKTGDNPFSIRLSRQALSSLSSSDPNMLKNEAEMTLLYGILKTFTHTGVDEVSVKSVSIDENEKFLDQTAISLTTNRENTLKALQDLGLADSFDQLVETRPNDKFRHVGLSSSDVYDDIVYKDDNRKALIEALK